MHAEAEALLRETLERFRVAFGHDCQHSLLTAEVLGEVLLKRSRAEDAEVLLRDTHMRMKSAWGTEHPNTLHTAFMLGDTLVRGGSSVEEGVELLTSTHDVQLRVLGPSHRATQDTLSLLERARESSGVQQRKKRRVVASK